MISKEKHPQIYIIAGPNGSGKTTFASSLIQNLQIPYLNPDLIATGLGPVDFEKASFQAGRVLIAQIREKLAAQESFAFETTMSGLSYAKYLRKAQEAGYSVHIHFVCLDSVRKNVIRIKKRVQMGGHNIPTKVVYRRHLRCFRNFLEIYKDLSNQWQIVDNSNGRPKLIMSSTQFKNLEAKDAEAFTKAFLRGKYGKV